MAKTEHWFTRLSVPTIDRIERLMSDFGFRSRDAFIEQAYLVLEAVRNGQSVPICVEEARQRHQQILIERSAKEKANAEGSTSSEPNGRDHHS